MKMAGWNLSGGLYCAAMRVSVSGFPAFRYHPCYGVGWGSRSYWLRPQRFTQSRFLELLLMAQCSCVETPFKPEGSGLFRVTELGALEEPGGGSMASYSRSGCTGIWRRILGSTLYPSPSGSTHSR